MRADEIIRRIQDGEKALDVWQTLTDSEKYLMGLSCLMRIEQGCLTTPPDAKTAQVLKRDTLHALNVATFTAYQKGRTEGIERGKAIVGTTHRPSNDRKG